MMLLRRYHKQEEKNISVEPEKKSQKKDEKKGK